MRRFAANKIQMSKEVCYCNAVIEITEDKTLSNVFPLDSHAETASTPFYNGILVVSNDDLQTINIGDKVTRLTLLQGERLLTEGIVSSQTDLL